LKTYLAEGIINKNQCVVVDSQDTYRGKDQWVKFMPNISKIKEKEPKLPAEEESKSTQDPDSEKLKVAWRYNNLLD